MSYSRRGRYDSYSPVRRNRSISRSISRSRSRSRSWDSNGVANPGNNLYVTGLSPRIAKGDLEGHFSTEGKVVECHLVVDPRTRESRGFGFVTMATLEDAERCIKHLNRSVLEGRVITVEKQPPDYTRAKRKRGRTPTPGKYLGVRPTRVRDYDRRRTYSRSSDRHSSRRSPSYSPYRGDRYGSPRYSPYDDRSYGRDRSVSPYYRRRDRSVSPYYRRRDRSVSPYYRRRDGSLSPYGGRDRSLSPYGRRDRSLSPYRRRDRSLSPYSRRNGAASPYSRRYRSVSPADSPYRGSNRP